MKKYLAFFLGLSLFMTFMSCNPHYSTDPKANIYVEKIGVDKVNAIVGEETQFKVLVNLENATFVETKLAKDYDISKWFTLKNIDTEGDKTQLSAKVVSLSESHVNKSDKKLFDTLTAFVVVTTAKEADGMLGVEIPVDFYTPNNAVKADSKKPISSQNKITIISKDKFYVRATLDKKEITSNYIFGKTDVNELILSLKNATFKDEVLNDELLKDSAKFSKYFSFDFDHADVAANYTFTFKKNGARNDSLILLVTSKTLMIDTFDVKDLPIKVMVAKDAYKPNKNASIKTERLEVTFLFTKTKESKSEATIGYIKEDRIATDLKVEEGKSIETKMLITLTGDSFNKDLLTPLMDIKYWFSIDGTENIALDSVLVERVDESPISKNEKEKIYTHLYCNVKLTGVKMHDEGKNTPISVTIPTLINTNQLLKRSKLKVKVGNTINITVTK